MCNRAVFFFPIFLATHWFCGTTASISNGNPRRGCPDRYHLHPHKGVTPTAVATKIGSGPFPLADPHIGRDDRHYSQQRNQFCSSVLLH